MRIAIRAALAVGSLVALAACSAIIGTRDLTFEPGTDGGVGGPDGSAPVPDGSTGATGTTDATSPTDDGGGGPDGASEAGETVEAGEAGADAGCSADLASDTHNCGACGHDCLGGACSKGVCQPVTLAAGLQGPWGIALSATHIYWSSYEAWQIWTSGKDGSNPTIVAHDAADGGEVSNPIDIATDDTFVYWMDNDDTTSDPTDVGRIARCPLAGCNGAPSHVVVTNLNSPAAMRVDDAGVLWGETNTGRVASASKADGGSLRVYVTGLSSIDDVFLDPSSAFWSTDDAIQRANRDAGGPDGGPFASIYAPGNGGIYPYGIAGDDTNLYYTVFEDPGLVQSIPKAGVGTGAPKTYASGLHYPVRVAVDATTVYWVNQGPNSGDTQNFVFTDGSIMSCPKAGCPAAGPTVLATGLAWPRRLAVDDVAVYWTVHGNATNDGAIMRLAK